MHHSQGKDHVGLDVLFLSNKDTETVDKHGANMGL